MLSEDLETIEKTQQDISTMLFEDFHSGGACAVGYLSTAVGSTMQISSEKRFSTMKNGYIRNIDGGIAPDIPLTLNEMFDRGRIDEIVSNRFGSVE
jgi:hypothetical protein